MNYKKYHFNVVCNKHDAMKLCAAIIPHVLPINICIMGVYFYTVGHKKRATFIFFDNSGKY